MPNDTSNLDIFGNLFFHDQYILDHIFHIMVFFYPNPLNLKKPDEILNLRWVFLTFNECMKVSCFPSLILPTTGDNIK